jgi:hypothetical protein
MKCLFIYWIWIDCTISIEKFDSCDLIKNILKKFFIQMNISVLKKIFWWKFTFNWKVWLMWFHKKHLKKVFYSNEHKCVEKNILMKNYFQLKDDKNYVAWRPLYQNPFYMFIKMLYEIKEKLPPKYTKIYPPQKYIFLPKATPP